MTCHMFVSSRKPAKRLGSGLFCEVGEIRGSGFAGKRWTNWVSSWTILQVFVPIDSLQVLLLQKHCYFLHRKKKGDKKAKSVYCTVFQAPSLILFFSSPTKSIAICSYTVFSVYLEAFIP